MWSLIRYLPQDSWTQTILRDDPNHQALVAEDPSEQRFGPWSQTDLLTAALIDAVNQVRFAVVRTGFNGNKEYPAPEPTARPGMKRLAQAISNSVEAEAARRYLTEFNCGKR